MSESLRFHSTERTPYWTVLVKSRPSVASLCACSLAGWGSSCMLGMLPGDGRLVGYTHGGVGGGIGTKARRSVNFRCKNRRAFAVNSRIVRKCSPIEEILVPLREMFAESGRSRSRPGQFLSRQLWERCEGTTMSTRIKGFYFPNHRSPAPVWCKRLDALVRKGENEWRKCKWL